MIFRPDYVEAVRPFIDQPLVKILAGVRRSGKSTIFEMIREELKQHGVGDDRILMKKYTEMDVPENITAKQMYDELTFAMPGMIWLSRCRSLSLLAPACSERSSPNLFSKAEFSMASCSGNLSRTVFRNAFVR